jgi:hypothetical protein
MPDCVLGNTVILDIYDTFPVLGEYFLTERDTHRINNFYKTEE